MVSEQPFQPELRPQPDPPAASAAFAVDQAMAAAGMVPDAAPSFSSVYYPAWLEMVGSLSGSGVNRLGARMAGTTLRLGSHLGSGVHGDYDPQISHYGLHWCHWPDDPDMRVGMLVYVGVIQRNQPRPGFGGGRRKITTWPPSPMTVSMFAALPGRIGGVVAYNRELRSFLPRPDGAPGQALMAALSDQALLGGLWGFVTHDVDLIGGRPVRRDQTQLGMERASQGVFRVVDPYFLPTLLESPWLDTRTWPGAPVGPPRRHIGQFSPSAKQQMLVFDPDKYFTVVLVPYRAVTLVVVSGPVATTFAPDGEILGSDLSLPYVHDLLAYLKRVVADPAVGREPTDSEAAERNPYWDIATGLRVVNVMGMSAQLYNTPIPPFEWVLAAAEGRG